MSNKYSKIIILSAGLMFGPQGLAQTGILDLFFSGRWTDEDEQALRYAKANLASISLRNSYILGAEGKGNEKEYENPWYINEAYTDRLKHFQARKTELKDRKKSSKCRPRATTWGLFALGAGYAVFRNANLLKDKLSWAVSSVLNLFKTKKEI